ncbi:MAG: porin [Burkholderiaceae bacterium]|nr:porin [Burkholderiaceae bacterium]
MKKSLLAVAVAAALPAAAFAQTNVTLSGIVKVGVANTKYSNGENFAGASYGNGSNTSLDDGSSRFIISGSEDLGGGMKGIFMVDSRFRPDVGTGTLASGNSFVGLAGGFGSIRAGRLDQYYHLGTDEFGARAVALQHSNISILSWVGGVGNLTAAGTPAATAAAATGVPGLAAIANASRSANMLRYDLPAMGGLSGGVGFSNNFQADDGAIGDAGKGTAWTADLAWRGGPITVGGAYWTADFEGQTATTGKNDGQRAWRLYGNYNFGVFSVGLTVDESKIKGITVPIVGATSGDFKRTAWSLPVTAKVGPGTLLFTYTQARDVKGPGGTLSDSGAKMFSIGYDYPLSKRTSVGVSYTNLNNDSGANYALFTSTALGGHDQPVAGTDQRQLYVGLRHAF